MKPYLFFEISRYGLLLFVWRLRISFIKSPALFSERNGYDLPLLRVGKWRLKAFIAKHL